jgi:hypothetical protein
MHNEQLNNKDTGLDPGHRTDSPKTVVNYINISLVNGVRIDLRGNWRVIVVLLLMISSGIVALFKVAMP